jgi:hypothetical protein
MCQRVVFVLKSAFTKKLRKKEEKNSFNVGGNEC